LLPSWTVALFERYASFFVTGASGVLLNLGVTWALTTYVFGVDQYFRAYLIGLAVNLCYNFVRHAYVTFDPDGGYVRRFVYFIVYSLTMAALQAWTVRELVSLFGEVYYLVVIASVIFVFSTVTFVVCETWLFAD
jgi:putative flippase GtrA